MEAFVCNNKQKLHLELSQTLHIIFQLSNWILFFLFNSHVLFLWCYCHICFLKVFQKHLDKLSSHSLHFWKHLLSRQYVKHEFFGCQLDLFLQLQPNSVFGGFSMEWLWEDITGFMLHMQLQHFFMLLFFSFFFFRRNFPQSTLNCNK